MKIVQHRADKGFTADVLVENGRMLHVFHKSGCEMESTLADRVYHGSAPRPARLPPGCCRITRLRLRSHPDTGADRSKRIAIIPGRPGPEGHHLGHALAESYAAGAEEARYQARVIDVAGLEFPLLRSKEDSEHGEAPESTARPRRRSAGPATW